MRRTRLEQIHSQFSSILNLNKNFPELVAIAMLALFMAIYFWLPNLTIFSQSVAELGDNSILADMNTVEPLLSETPLTETLV